MKASLMGQGAVLWIVSVVLGADVGPVAAQRVMVPDDRLDNARVTLMRDAASGIVALPAGITGEGLKALLGPTIARLEDAANKAAGVGQFVLQDAVTQLRQMQFDLDRSLGANVRVPIENLTLQSQVIASTLYASMVRMNDLLAHQQGCLVQNSDLVVSGLRAAVASAKEGIPLIQSGEPWLASYRFDGLRTAFVVPRVGGRFTITGYKLWGDAGAPEVRLLASDRKQVLATLPASQGPDANTLSADLTPQVVASQAGKCLGLEVTAYDRVRSGLLNLGSRVRKTTRVLPLCVAEHHARQLQFVGNVRYEVNRNVKHELEAKQFPEATNSSCGTHPLYTAHLQWAVPRGYEITSFRFEWQDSRYDDGRTIAVNKTAYNQITAAGNMASPRCGCVLGVCKLFSHSFWRARVVPTIEGTGPVPVADSAKVGPVEFLGNRARTCMKIPKHAASNSTTFWVSITDRGQNRLVPWEFTSARQTVSTGFTGPVGTHQGYMIEAEFNPTPVDRTCELCVTLRSTSDCGF